MISYNYLHKEKSLLFCRAYSMMTSLSGKPTRLMWHMLAEIASQKADLPTLRLCYENMGNMDDALHVQQVGCARIVPYPACMRLCVLCFTGACYTENLSRSF